jgi:hypothetical protein
MLKTAAESYTRSLFSDFEREFKEQFPLSCTLLDQEGLVGTYKITNFNNDEDEAIVIFNSDNLNISCSCKMYDCSGIRGPILSI